MERDPGDAQPPGRLAPVAAGLAQGLHDEPSLVRLHPLLERQRIARRRSDAREEREVEPLGRRERDQPLDRVLELADVAGPGEAGEAMEERLLEVHRGRPEPLREPGEEVAGEDGDVLGPLAQRRDAEVDDVEPVEQVLAEPPGPDLLREVAVGRGEDADVYLAHALLAHRADLALLEDPEQLRLRARRQLPHLVEEDRPAVGLAEQAGARPGRAGEGAAGVPEERRLAVLVGRVAPRDVTVLVSGESGTGKERVAEALVQASPRAGRPFVRFNCAALAPELAEAELFGHARGAFTGAIRARPGLFGEADGGTLLLDEVAELTPGAQGKLLRVLQEGEVRAVGEERVRKVDVRVIASTHRDLSEEVRAGRFRDDLFYRLDVVHLAIPPLRERPEDVPVLVRHFLARFADRFGVPAVHAADALVERLSGQAWPGNVRELAHVIERLVALSPPEGLDLSLLPGAGRGGDREPLALRERVQAYERGLLVEALREARGNRSEAARRLGVSRVTLHDKLRRYGLGDGDDR